MPPEDANAGSELRITTDRLELIPANAERARADAQHDAAELGRLLAARVPEQWPPELTLDVLDFWADTLAAHPEQTGWWNWYFVLLGGEPEDRVLVGGGGFGGPPDDGGLIKTGYSVLEPFQRRGIATEAMRALVDWAFEEPGVQTLVAETFPHLAASLGVIANLGLTYVGDGEEPGAIRFGLPRGVYESRRG